MRYLSWTSVGLALMIVTGPFFQRLDAQQNINLGGLESTIVSVSSVNGKREPNNPYYGTRNLVDGGRNLIAGINYTTWLSDRDASPWIRFDFRNPVDIQSIMLELTALSSPSPTVISELDPTTTRSSNPHRPQEVALDVAYEDRDGRRRVDRLPSTVLKGFRTYYPLEKPLKGAVGLTLVFPGPSMVEVAEIEVLGTAR